MCFPPTLRYMELECVFCLQKFRLQQSILGLLQLFLFVFLPEAVVPLQLPAERRRIANWPLQSEKPDAGADRPSASGILLNVVFLFCMVRTTKQDIKIKDSFLEEM